MNFKSLQDVLDFAIAREKEAAAFYEELSKKEPFSGAKDALEDFAKQEKKHQKMLEDFSIGKLDFEKYDFKWIPDMQRSNYMVNVEYHPGMSYPDIIRLAMKREENALKLYNELIQKSDNNDCIKLFQMLAQEEAKHKNILETMYDDFMAEQGD